MGTLTAGFSAALDHLFMLSAYPSESGFRTSEE